MQDDVELLAAIYASPHDDGPRAVYADWLSERGLPRGELIAIQLARHRGDHGPAAKERERVLLDAHGREWAGALDAVLEEEGRVFDRGFLAEGRIRVAPSTARDPALATLRAIRGLGEAMLFELATGAPWPHVEELEVVIEGGGDEARRSMIRESTAFPHLRRLTLRAPPIDETFTRPTTPIRVDDVITVLGGAFAGCLERLTFVDARYRLGELVTAVGDDVKTIVGEHPRQGQVAAYRFVVLRDATGSLSRVRVESDDGRLFTAYSILSLLDSFATDALTELSFAVGLRGAYMETERQNLESALSRFSRIETLDVPWDRSVSPEPVRAIDLQLVGPKIGPRRLEELLSLAAEEPLALSFDAYVVDAFAAGAYAVNASPIASLPDDSSALRRRIVEGEPIDDVTFFTADRAETSAISLRNTIATIRCRYLDDLGFLDAWLAWLGRALDVLGAERGEVRFQALDDAGRRQLGATFSTPQRLGPLQREHAWIVILGERELVLLPPEELAKLPTREDLAWLRVARFERHVALVMGERREAWRPAEPLVLALYEVMWRTYPAVRGFEPTALVRDLIAPYLAERGFAEIALPPTRRARGEVMFVARDERGARAVRFALVDPMEATTTWAIELLGQPGEPGFDFVDSEFHPDDWMRLDALPASTGDHARAALVEVRERLASDLLHRLEGRCS